MASPPRPESGFCASASASATGSREIGEDHAKAPLLRPCVEQPPGAAVAIVRGEHEAAGRHQFQHQRHRRHAARGDHRAGALLEFGERLGRADHGSDCRCANSRSGASALKPRTCSWCDRCSGGTTAPCWLSDSMPARTARVETGQTVPRAVAGGSEWARLMVFSGPCCHAAGTESRRGRTEGRSRAAARRPISRRLHRCDGSPAGLGTLRGRFPAGCPGVEGPVPQPVWMGFMELYRLAAWMSIDV